MSASRWPWRLAPAVSINLSTSSVVRCSLVRSWAFGRRTVRFTIAGEVGGSGEFSIGFASFDLRLFRVQLFSAQYPCRLPMASRINASRNPAR